MKKPLHLIYVPGILDDIYHVQSVAVATWRLHGVEGHCHEIPWAGPEAWQPKFERLLAKIDQLTAQGYAVGLVGASAGASAVLNAYAERPDQITGVVYICAKINASQTVSSKTYADNPAFKTSLAQLQKNLTRFSSADKAKMLSLYSPADKSVPHSATVIPGVQEQQLPALSHSKAILYSLTPGASIVIGFFKRQREVK